MRVEFRNIIKEDTKLARALELSKHEPLPKKEELKLLRHYKATGCLKSRDKVLLANTRLIYSISKNYTFNERNKHEDTFQVAFEAAMTSLSTFDTTKNTRFSNWAVYYMVRDLQHYVYRKNVDIPNPNPFIKRIKELDEAGLTPEEIRQEIHPDRPMTLKLIKNVIRTDFRFDSLDRPLTEDEELMLSSKVGFEDENFKDFENQDFSSKVIKEAYNCLKYKEKRVIDYLLKNSYWGSNTEIADQIGITKEAVRQLKVRAIVKMKNYLNHKNVKDAI